MLSAATSPALAAPAGPVLVFAAASLQTALTAIAGQWQRETGKRAVFSFAATSKLARQIDQGAPADLFASADQDWMDWAETRKLIRRESRRTLLGNSLVLIEAADRPATPLAISPGFALAEAIGDSRLATGDTAAVPAGRYARAALAKLGMWENVRSRIVGVENVRSALALVARGEARFGIVYETDARSEPRVRVVGQFPAESHPPILYSFALTTGSTNPDAVAFLAYLASPEALRLFAAEGFAVPA